MIILVLVALLVTGVVLERRDPGAASTRVDVATADGPVVPADDVVSTAWYCPAGTAVAGGGADETVFVANLSPREITATVAVVRGADADADTRRLRVAAYARAVVRVADIAAVAEAGVVVEVFGGPAIVEHEIRGSNDVAMGPCADEPARTWYLASGTTVRGTTQTLELLNPFGDDAVLDVTFLTETGVQEPQALQGLVVGRRSKVRVPVHDLVPRQERVATIVRTRTGRVVAEQVRSSDGTDGRAGLAVTLGSVRPRREWTLPVAAPATRVPGVVSLANFGIAPASVEVSVLLGGEAVLSPEIVSVPSRSVIDVDPSARIPVGAAFAVVVRALGPTPVVADLLLASSGIAVTGSASTTARRWALAGSPTGASSAVLAVNRSARPVTVELRAYTAGDVDSPRSAPAIVVAAGAVGRFDLAEWGVAPAQVLVVSADGPVVVGRETSRGGLSVAVGVPSRS
jgi:hypothetical protein